ncbi:MAG: hypothetical protein GY953_36175 [bacterium]|nr:hypothetical protein [bacterium]
MFTKRISSWRRWAVKAVLAGTSICALQLGGCGSLFDAVWEGIDTGLSLGFQEESEYDDALVLDFGGGNASQSWWP